MKRIITSVSLILLAVPLFAKKVKFMVDMRNEIINANGIHVTGDFQTLAGYAGGDWEPSAVLMTQEPSDTNIYSVIVDIPAKRKYEFKYVNGMFGYDTEFVPLEARVAYNFVDNRWIWIDSLANDTTILPAVIYGTNAPKGKYLLRLKVDMQNETAVDPDGVHVAGFFNNYTSAANYMYSFDGNVHELITYVDTGTTLVYEYLFYNGALAESVPSACIANNSRRGTQVLKDSVQDAVCFSSCAACSQVGIEENNDAFVSVFPNPATECVYLTSTDNISVVTLADVAGKIVYSKNNFEKVILLDRSVISSGIYFLECRTAEGERIIKKIVLE